MSLPSKGVFYSRSRYPGAFKKIRGFEEWFYTGPSRVFGHVKKVRSG